MTGYSWALAAGLALLGAAALLDLTAGARRERRERERERREREAREAWLRAAPYLLGAAASACLAVTGAGALAGRAVRVGGAAGAGGGAPATTAGGLLGAGHGWLLGAGTGGLAADRLSGLFLLIAFGAATMVSLAFASWAAHTGPVRRGLGAGYALCLGAVAVVLTATDAFTLLFAWESVTVAFYLLAGFDRDRSGRPAAALVTFAFGKVSGAALLAGLLLLADRSGSLALASFGSVPAGAARTTAQVLLLAGFAVKVGLVPFQVWMARGYAAAPGPARAVMAGVAVNVGFYGLWRTLAVLGPAPAWLAGLLLVLAGLTAILGIAHAAVQQRLQQVIGYSSVENTGLILAGFGVALVGAGIPDEQLVAAGLLAATLQVIVNAVAKSLLFTASAGIEAAGRSDDLDQVRGMARRAPWSATGLAVGSLTLAGLPPASGFVSEWFLLEALMQQFRVPGLGDRLVLAITGAAVALTAGFAGVTFVRLVGMVVLGPGRHGPGTPRAAGPGGQDRRVPPARARQADLSGLPGRIAIVLLSAACLGIGAVSPLAVRVISAGLSPVVPALATRGALRSPWVLQPVFSGFSILSPGWLWIAMPALLACVVTVALAASGGRLWRVRRVPAWRSATAGVEGAGSYTAFGFANPARRVLAGVLHTRAQTRQVSPGDQARTAHVGYSSDIIEVVEEYLYRPVLRPVQVLARQAKRLQSGRLDAYLAYMLIALIALLALVTALR